MTHTFNNLATKTARERFEELVSRYAPQIERQDFRLTSESEYAELVEGIESHKYLVNEILPFELTMEQAMLSWYENVYLPVMQAIDLYNLQLSFPGATRGELFLWVTRHWHFLKQAEGETVTVEEAVCSYGGKYGLGGFNRFLFRVKRLVA